MKKCAFLLALILTISGSSLHGKPTIVTPKIPASFLNELEKADEHKKFPVLVQLDDFPGQEKLYERIGALPMHKRRQKGPELIKEQIKKHHQALLTWLKRDKTTTGAKSHWISNSISLEAPKDIILELNKRKEIESILWDRQIKILPEPPVQSATQDVLCSSKSTPWGILKIGADKVWRAGITGRGVVIGGVDSGVRYTHVDLQSHMWINSDEIQGNHLDDDGNGYADDYYGYDFANREPDPMDDNTNVWHGTHTAGTFAGDGTGGTNTGVAPDAQIMALKALSGYGAGSTSSTQDAIEYGIDNGADVLNLSIGYSYRSYNNYTAFQYVKNAFRKIFATLLTVGIPAAVPQETTGALAAHPSI